MGLLNESTGRRKFIIVNAILLGGLAAIKKLWPLKSPERKTVKLLMRDGTLVEVDASHLPRNKRAIKKEELVSWIWKNQKL